MTVYACISSLNTAELFELSSSNMRLSIDGEWRAVVRYDEAHGYYHRDVMSPFGGQTKVAQPAADMHAALADAIADIKKNWREYRRAYEAAQYGKK